MKLNVVLDYEAMPMKPYKIAAILSLLFIIAPVLAEDNVTVNDQSGTIVLEVGNLTKTYTLAIQLLSLNTTFNSTNATFYMPYGIVNMTPCNGGTGFRRVNATLVSCEIAVGNITQLSPPAPNVPTGVTANLTITANISAYSFYTAAQAFNITFTSTNVTGIINSTIKNITAVSSRRNPRPEAVNTNGTNSTLIFTFWNQSDKGYKVMTPIYTFDPNAGRPVLSNNSYGEILYFDKSFFEMPSFMKLWSYNLTFRFVFTGGPGAVNYTIRSPINNSQFPVQSLTPLFIQTMPQQDFVTNTTRNFTMGIPNPNSFTVYWNGTNYTQTVLATSTGLSVSFTGGGGAGSDQSISLLSITIPNETIAETVNNTDISVLFTLTNITACGTTSCTTSPIFVNSQSISGWSPDSPPQFGGSLNISYVINVTNTFTNYTLDNLSISIMQPMNVTMVGATTQQFNMTRLSSVRISVWNGSVFVENLSVVRRESNFSFSDAHGPSGANVSLYITTFDVVLSSAAHVNGSFGWEPNSSGTVLINFTAEMTFPILNETAPPSGTAGTTNHYNVTTNQPQRAPLNLTGKVAGLDNSSTGINVTIDGVQVAASNLTIGSLIIKDVTSGQHVISVTYTVPAAAASTTTTTTSSSGGGAVPDKKATNTLSEVLSGKENRITIYSSAIDFEEIRLEVTEKLTEVKFSTTQLSSKPADVADPSGKVVQYINLTAENLPKEKIKAAKIRFSVLKSWLDNNNYTSDDIALYRYTNAWDKLKTTKENESSTTVFFIADTPGFSTFVIAAEKVVAAASPTPATTPPAAPAPTASATVTPVATPVPSAAPVAGIEPQLLTYAVIAIVLLGAAYLFMRWYTPLKRK